MTVPAPGLSECGKIRSAMTIETMMTAAAEEQNRTGQLARAAAEEQNRIGQLARVMARAAAEEQNRIGQLARMMARAAAEEQNRTEQLARVLARAAAVQEQNQIAAGLARVLARAAVQEQNRIAWPRKILTDYGERADFYVSRGLKGARPDFSAPAFEKSLDIADLRGDKLLLVDLYGSPPPELDNDHKEKGRARMAYVRITGLETQLRRCIDERMTACYGSDWPKHQLPNGMYDQWQEKKRKAQQSGREEDALIDYADFTDYVQVMCKRDNWHVFSPIFDRKENVRESFQRMYPVRVDTMHARQITQDDALLLYFETRRLSKAMNSSGCGGIVCIRH